MTSRALTAALGSGERCWKLLPKPGSQAPVWPGRLSQRSLGGGYCKGGMTKGPDPAGQTGLIQRADDPFAARPSPRQMRPAHSATAAARTTFLDKEQKPDEAGAAIPRGRRGVCAPACVQAAISSLNIASWRQRGW
jgi:hypothetical protein